MYTGRLTKIYSLKYLGNYKLNFIFIFSNSYKKNNSEMLHFYYFVSSSFLEVKRLIDTISFDFQMETYNAYNWNINLNTFLC